MYFIQKRWEKKLKPSRNHRTTTRSATMKVQKTFTPPKCQFSVRVKKKCQRNRIESQQHPNTDRYCRHCWLHVLMLSSSQVSFQNLQKNFPLATVLWRQRPCRCNLCSHHHRRSKKLFVKFFLVSKNYIRWNLKISCIKPLGFHSLSEKVTNFTKTKYHFIVWA